MATTGREAARSLGWADDCERRCAWPRLLGALPEGSYSISSTGRGLTTSGVLLEDGDDGLLRVGELEDGEVAKVLPNWPSGGSVCSGVIAAWVPTPLAEVNAARSVYPQHLQATQGLVRLQVRTGRTNEHTLGMLDDLAIRGEDERWRTWARTERVKIAARTESP